MRIRQFLEHHGIDRNPFAEEDAQTDPVFKDYCIDNTYHPSWDKVYGDPAEPATSIVFGEKGSGKTALRLQIAQHATQYNRQNPGQRLFIIQYDDFNPFLDRFRDRLSGRRRRADRALLRYQLWDHMDAILSLGVTDLVQRVLAAIGPADTDRDAANSATREAIDQLDRHQRRDLLLLAACYDQSTAETLRGRWHRLQRILRFWNVLNWWRVTLGSAVSILVISVVLYMVTHGHGASAYRHWYLAALAAVAGWVPWLWHAGRCFHLAWGVARHVRVGNRQIKPLCRTLMNFTPGELAGQPLPNKDRTDDRYGLLGKFQSILKTFGFSGIIVLVDRVDEPHLINGSAELMRAMLWPMLDNKFLKHPGLGLKFMLPAELTQFIDREDREFYQRARLDKQNMVPSLEWTGEALYDVANARLQACAIDGAEPTLQQLLDPSISQQRLLDAFRTLRVPRDLFKFLYRLIVAHCGAHSDQDPKWTISSETFQSVLAVYQRGQQAAGRGLGVG